MPSSEFPRLLQETRRISKEIAAPAAAAVDRDARFPHETLAALRDARLLSAAVPAAFGGAGLSLAKLAGCATRWPKAARPARWCWRCTRSRSAASRATQATAPSSRTCCAPS